MPPLPTRLLLPLTLTVLTLCWPSFAAEELTSHVVHVSPTELADITSPNTVVLLALYVPGLPKWTTHMSPVLETVASHFQNESRVVIAAANCKQHKKFVKQFALRSFPTVMEFPPLPGAPLPFHVRYDPELTAADYVEDIESMLVVALSSNPFLDEVHSGMQAFMDSQALVDHSIGWVGAAERHAKLAARERQWRRFMLREDVPEPDPKEDLDMHRRRIKAMELGLDPNLDDISMVELDDVPEGDATPTPAPTVDPEAEKLALAPLRYAANQALLYANVQQAKVKYYSELLDLVEKYGSASVSRQLHKTTTTLYRNHEFMTEEVRDELLMKISVLNQLAQHLLGE